MKRLAGLLVVLLAGLGVSPAQQAQLGMKISVQGRKKHPTVYMTRADILLARANRDKFPWAKQAAEKLLAAADQWADKSDEDLVKLVPAPKSCYAYGFAGCPICGGPLASWWGAGGVCSLSDPGHIRCVHGHRLPDDAHPDAGSGYTDKTGKKFYFAGVYNSYVIDVLTTATTQLVNAYALSGDVKYAHKAALILDNLARVYPTSETGSWDYPSDPPSGRFNRPWYQVARTLVLYANQYDILMMGSELDAPSSTPGLTRRENIEKNLLLNGAAYCYRESVLDAALNNGEADYIRGPMAVGAAMGIPEYIWWGVDGPYSIRAMIANNIDRDGEYYETSLGYSEHARGLYMNMAEIVRHYSDAKYPGGIDLAGDPVFFTFNMLAGTRLRCATQTPSLGDDAPNLKRIASTQRVNSADLNNLERLRALSDDPGQIKKLDGLLAAAADGNVEAMRARSASSEWLLFHANPVSEPAGPLKNPLTGASLEESDLFAQKGLAILRGGGGENARAATLRFGPTLNHGHWDEMNLDLYARGYEMSYDLGYSLGSTHTQVGWAHNTASHNTVVVDETPQLRAGRSGGSLDSFTALPGVTIVRANDPACYQSQGVRQYARTVAMVDVNPDLSYLVDVFHIEGGQKHDYFFHGLGTDVSTEGLELGAAAEGSLAGEDIHWGDRIGSDGNVEGVVNKDYWNPPPGNGYGFLMHPRSAAPANGSVWSATWAIDRGHPANVRLNMLTAEPMNVVKCEAPGIYPKEPKATYLVARRAGEDKNLVSTFAAIIEPYGEKRAIAKITPLPRFDQDVAAAKIELVDGRVDYVLWSQSPAAVHLMDGAKEITFAGGFAIARCDDKGPLQVTMVGGRELKIGGWKVSLPAAEQSGTIERIDEANDTLYTKAKIAGPWVQVTNGAYAQESPYRIAATRQTDDGLTAIQLSPTRLELGRGHLDENPSDPTKLPNVVPIEYAKSQVLKSSGFFRGKRIATPDGTVSTRIVDFDNRGMTITVESSKGFKAGDDLIIYDACAGDGIQAPGFIQARRAGNEGPAVESNMAGASVSLYK